MLFVVCSDVSATRKIGCFRVPKIIPRNGLFTQIEPISQKNLPLEIANIWSWSTIGGDVIVETE